MATAVGFPAKDLKEEEPEDWKHLTATTSCLRCSGLIVIVQYSDFPVWRCVQCGEVIDPVILRNRRHNGRDELDFNQR